MNIRQYTTILNIKHRKRQIKFVKIKHALSPIVTVLYVYYVPVAFK